LLFFFFFWLMKTLPNGGCSVCIEFGIVGVVLNEIMW
jgi:hypothetical protein